MSTIDASEIQEVTIDGTAVQEITMDGSVVWKATTYIDSFEDGDIAEYSNNTTWWTVTDASADSAVSATDGSWVLEYVHGNRDKTNPLISTPGSGLPNYFPKGTIARVDFRSNDATGGEMAFYFGVQDSSNAYIGNIRYDNDWLEIIELNGGSLSQFGNEVALSQSLSADTWYTIRVVRDDGTLGGNNDDITVECLTQGGTNLGSKTINDATFASYDGVGFMVAQQDHSGSVRSYFDFARRED